MKCFGATVFENTEIAAWQSWWEAKKITYPETTMLSWKKHYFSFLPPTSTSSNEKSYSCILKINLYSATILWSKNLLLVASQKLDPWKFASTYRIQKISDKTEGFYIPAQCIFGSWEIYNAFLWHCICVRTTFKVKIIE